MNPRARPRLTRAINKSAKNAPMAFSTTGPGLCWYVPCSLSYAASRAQRVATNLLAALLLALHP